MNTHTGKFDLPVVPGGKIPAYDSETGIIQDATSLRDPASYRLYLTMRMAGEKNGSRQSGGQTQAPAE